MNIPTTEQCMEMLKEYNVPKNIIEHSKQVNRVAMFLAKKLKQAGVDINLDLLNAASLLHDLDKKRTIDNNKEHGYLAKKILAEKGCPEVGDLIIFHRRELLRGKSVNTWERKIINYADSRVLNDKIVSLKQRFEYGREKYPHFTQPKYRATEDTAKKIEKEICKKAKIKPEDVK